MHSSVRVLPQLASRLAEGRPVLAKEQLTALAKRVIGMSSADTVSVSVRHTANIVTRLANGQVLSSDDGDDLEISLSTRFGDTFGTGVTTNQLDDTSLRAIVEQSEAVARDYIGFRETLMPHQATIQDTFVPTHLWHDETIQAMTTTRGAVIPEILSAVKQDQLRGAGFLGLMARAEALMTKEGIFAFSEETDAELTVSARNAEGTGSGWSGHASRNWATIKPSEVARRAIDVAKRSANPVAIEPGRRTAILTPAAVVQIIRYLAPHFDAFDTDRGLTALSKMPNGNKLGQRVFDPRISMSSHPDDPDGGYCPFFDQGLATPAMKWVENGVLKNLAYNRSYAMARGKVYAENPWSIRLSGGTTTIEEMIAQCKEGVFVNRFSSVDPLDFKTGLTTGITRDGCFLVKDGKIARPIKNFRFLESPFFFLNRIEALGVPERAAFGYTPRGNREVGPTRWPRRPIIAPPMMVRDFNFSALEDAV